MFNIQTVSKAGQIFKDSPYKTLRTRWQRYWLSTHVQLYSLVQLSCLPGVDNGFRYITIIKVYLKCNWICVKRYRLHQNKPKTFKDMNRSTRLSAHKDMKMLPLNKGIQHTWYIIYDIARLSSAEHTQ